MTGPLLLQRQEITQAGVLCGAAVSSGRQWYPLAYAADWLSGQSAVLVPGCVIDKDVLSTTTGVLHFRAKTRLVAIERVWTLMLRGSASGTSAVIKAPASTGTAQTVRASSERDVRMPVVYRELLTAKASAVTDLTIEITATGGDIAIDSVSCYELARPILSASAEDVGIDPTTMRPRERIFAGNGYQSVTGAYAGILAADPRRVGIYQWSVPVITPITTTGAYADVLTLACPVLARKLESGATQATVKWSVYAKVSSGSGDVDVYVTSGDTDTANITGTSFAWTTAQDLTIDCEDMAEPDGRQGSAWDDLQWKFRANGGVTLSVAALSVWDEAT